MVMSNQFKIYFLMVMSFLVGMILTILPLPESMVWYRPEWMAMILFFWLISAPNYVGVFTAFFIGLLTDLLTGAALGLHALLFSLIAFFVLHFYIKIHGLPTWQRTLMLLAILLVYFAIQGWVYHLVGVPSHFGHFFLPAIVSTLLWPWVCSLLSDFQQRYENN